MEFRFTPEEETVRREVADFLRGELRPGWMGVDYDEAGNETWAVTLRMRKRLAHRSDWMMLLARTAPDAPRHRGTNFSKPIASGTSEIQRHIIATRGLGLPRA